MAMKTASTASGGPVQPDGSKRAAGFGARSERVAATLAAAVAAGLMQGRKDKRLSGRTSSRLVEAAAARSGLESSDLLEYALAKVALEDDFVEALLALRGTINRDVELGV